MFIHSPKNKIKSLLLPFIALFLSLNLISCSGKNPADNIHLFPMANYSQDLNTWFNSDDPDFNTSLMEKEEQNKYFAEMKSNTYGTQLNDNSPWSESYIKFLLSPEVETGKTIFEGEVKIIGMYRIAQKNLVGINFRPYSNKYLDNMQRYMNLTSLAELKYNPANRAIMIDNAVLHELPTQEIFAQDRNIAGQGYPFDNARLSAAYLGNAVYIITQTTDKAWSLVVTASTIAWIPSQSVRRVTPAFIKTWNETVAKSIGSIAHSTTPILDKSGNFVAQAYLGSIFPITSTNASSTQILVPTHGIGGKASILTTTIPTPAINVLPLALTRANLKKLLAQTIDRPYGWGNLDFFHDCSSELRALYSHFGIMMPRNSIGQSKFMGEVVDLSEFNEKERFTKLPETAKPLLSLMYLNGHIMLYLGEYDVKVNGKIEKRVMSYQNVWGLRPADNSRREVIGKSVIFPIMLKYPEMPDITSLLSRPLFKVIQMEHFKGYKTKLGLSNLLY